MKLKLSRFRICCWVWLARPRPPLGHVGVSPSRGPERHAVLAIRHGPDMLDV